MRACEEMGEGVRGMLPKGAKKLLDQRDKGLNLITLRGPIREIKHWYL